MQQEYISNGNAQEHIKEAAAVIGQYCDIIGIRSFPSFERKLIRCINSSFDKLAVNPGGIIEFGMISLDFILLV